MCFFFQEEDGIRDLVRSRGLGDVYKRQEPLDLLVDRADGLNLTALVDRPGDADALANGDELSLIHI